MDKKKKIAEAMQKIKVAKVESALYRGAEKYFTKEGYTYVPSVPHIVDITGACENVDTLYSIDYHGQEAFLTQTGQTALEILLTNGIEKVCCMIHSFRCEEEVDNRHLTEFPLVELEFTYDPEKDGFELLLEEVENTIKSMMQETIETEKETLQELGIDVKKLRKIISERFQRITYDEAVKIAGKEWGEDLNATDEQIIVHKYGNKPVFVMRYPEEIKFFNMQRNRKKPRIVNSSDLLLPYSGEAAGAAVRESNYRLLIEKLKNSQMFKILKKRGKTVKDFAFYLDAVKQNPVPHAGCGIGLTRVTQFILGTQDIRQSTPYPMNKETFVK